jgi:hypothetical protein
MFDAMKSKFNNLVEAGLGGQIIVGKWCHLLLPCEQFVAGKK